MKKDIEWLRKRLNQTIKFEALNDREMGFKLAMEKVIDLLNQLDEPEVLSQEVPVIPKYVGDWITKYRKVFDLYPALEKLEESPLIWGRIYKWYRMNTHKFVNIYLTGAYEVEEEQKYYALVKGHELLKGKGDWVVPTYWCLDTTNGNMFVSDRITVRDKFLIEASKSGWNKLGINDSNADFIKVEEDE